MKAIEIQPGLWLGNEKTANNLNFIKTGIQWYEGKYFMVSRDLSIFIGEQEKLAKDMAKNMPGVEDLMVGYLTELF